MIGKQTTVALSVALGAIFFGISHTASAQQQPGKVPRIGVLSPLSPEVAKANHQAFQRGLRELGYVDGNNILIEYRFSGGSHQRLPELAAELMALKVDVIVTAGTPGVSAAKRATNTTPIVIAAIGDAVESGFIASLARPGGNVTGLSFLNAELEGKRLELLKEALPRLSSVAVLGHESIPEASSTSLKRVAKSLSMKLHFHSVTSAEQLERAFGRITAGGTEALQVLASPILAAHRKSVVTLALRHRLPAVYQWKEFVDARGMMSYAASLTDMYRRAAIYVDKILKESKPADLPVEQPTKFDLVINLKTAKQIGITIPPHVLARADMVIR